MTPKAKYFLVGLFVVLLSITSLAFLVWLAGGKLKQETDTYLVYMNESVSGLPENAPVKFMGVTIGRVKQIRLDSTHTDRVELRLEIQKGTPIKNDSHAVLASRGITGIQYIEISGGSQEGERLRAKPGQKHPVIPSQLSALSTAQESIGPILQNINLAILDIRDLLRGTEDLNRILKDIRVVTDQLARQPNAIPDLLEEINSLSTELNRVAIQIQQMAKTSDSFLNKRAKKVDDLLIASRSLVENLDAVARQVDESNIVTKANQTVNSADQLLTSVDSRLSYLELEETLAEIQITLASIQDLTDNLNKTADEFRDRASPLILSRPEKGVQP